MNNIKRYRGLAGISQKDFAEKLEMTRAGLIYIENGKIGTIRKNTLNKMCDILNATPTQLLGLDNLKYLPSTIEDIDYMISLLQKLKEGK